MRSDSLHHRVRTGVVTGDTRTVIITNRLYASGRPAVIYAAAYGVGAGNVAGFSPAIELTRRGYVVGCTDAGDAANGWLGGGSNGPGVWGNDVSITRFGLLLTHLRTAYGASNDPAIVLYGSHGAALAFNWARQNLSDVACILGAIGTVDVEDIRANNRNSYQASIETAYTNNATWQAARPTHNPVEYADELAGIPTRIYYGPDDTICLQSTQEAMAAGIGDAAELVSLGAGVGHALTGLDWSAAADWIEAQL